MNDLHTVAEKVRAARDYEEVVTVLADALVERGRSAGLDMDRLARAAVEPYDIDPVRGRCRVCGEDGVVVGEIADPEGLAAEYERAAKL